MKKSENSSSSLNYIENSIAVIKISGGINKVTGTANSLGRINPFNQRHDHDDDLSVSMASEVTSIASDDSGDISLTELGLTEDYFAHPQGRFGMSTVEELELTIENCKSMILELPEKSPKRKKIVKKLVELRIKLQELREGPEEIELTMKHVLGHKFRKRNSNSIKHYCDACNSLIWGMLQVWYTCKECTFHCHSKCVNNIQRKCVAVGLTATSYILNICPEIGLSAQHHRCSECKNSISIEGSNDQARLCDYSGQYFCPMCHWSDLCIIPGRVLHNWDFVPRKVCRRSSQLLSRMSHRAVLNVEEINPMLFNYVEELTDIRKMREDILMMKEYLTTCVSALDKKLLLELHDRQHFVEDSKSYSMIDLVQIQEGLLMAKIANIRALFAHHIKCDCINCQAKGFVCEVCNSGEALFPFDAGVSTCLKCSAVFHRDCFTCIDTLCPRCDRKLKKKKMIEAADTSSSQSDSDMENDYLRGSSHQPIKHTTQQTTPTNSSTNSYHRSNSNKLSEFLHENPSDVHLLGFKVNNENK